MPAEEKNKLVDDEEIEDEDLFDEEEDDEEIDEDDIVEDEEEEEEEESKSSDAKKKVQDEEERAKQARLRREREAKEREEREKAIEQKAFLKGQLEATKVNSFTNEPIEDEYDLKIYNIQKELEKEGKDPIADLPKKLAQLDRSASQKKQEEEKAVKEKNDKIDNDISDFKSKYPNVNVMSLLEDEGFNSYSTGKLGSKQTLAEIYEDYLKFKEKYFAKEKGEEKDDGKKSAPSPNGGRKHEDTPYSKMSKAEKEKELKRLGLIN